jgi:hypothetical protein
VGSEFVERRSYVDIERPRAPGKLKRKKKSPHNNIDDRIPLNIRGAAL